MSSRNTLSENFPLAYVSIALIFVYLIVLIRTAWLSDDAYITFRYAYNVVNGYGLTWNPGYRVQAYSNPLWMLLVSVAYFVTREIYYTSLVLSMLFSIGTLGILWRLATSQKQFWLGAGILILSKAFVDYSTSGLEDPFLHFLLAIFAYVFLTESRPHKRLLYVSLVGALAMTTRMDAVLLVAPAVFVTARDVIDVERPARTSLDAVRTMAIGGIPFIAWKSFATFYYGYPVPNTYFAKTNTTDTTFELLQHGYHYLVGSFAHDFILLVGLAAGFAAALMYGDRRLRALAAGSGLYLLYILSIGGDFMAGRLLSEPLLVSVIILVRTVDISAETAKVGLLVLIAVSVGLPTAPPVLQTLQSGADYGGATINEHGIVDERGFYYQGTGLIANKDRKNTFRWADLGRHWRDSSKQVRISGVTGMRGYYAGPDVHIIDYHALTDPLLAHMEADGRVGHYARQIPAGYVKSIETGQNRLKSEGLHRFYDKIAIMATGDLWSVKRAVTIVKMNLGMYDHLLTSRLRWTYPLHRINTPVADGTEWNAPRAIVFHDAIDVTMDGPVYSDVVEISADHNDTYRLEFINNGTVVGSAMVRPSKNTESGILTRRVEVPPEAVKAGYSRIRITAVEGDGKYSIGHVRLVNQTGTAREPAKVVIGDT